MCPRISVPASPPSPLPPRPHPPPLAFSASISMCTRVYVYLYKKIPPPPYIREVVGYPPAPTPSFSLSFSFSYPPFSPTVRAHGYILYLSPPTTYTPPSSRRTTGIISVFPQTRLTRNVVQQALRALSTGRGEGYPPPPLRRFISLVPPSAFDSTPPIDNSRLILRESGLLSRAAPRLPRVHGEFRGSR